MSHIQSAPTTRPTGCHISRPRTTASAGCHDTAPLPSRLWCCPRSLVAAPPRLAARLAEPAAAPLARGCRAAAPGARRDGEEARRVDLCSAATGGRVGHHRSHLTSPSRGPLSSHRGNTPLQVRRTHLLFHLSSCSWLNLFLC